MCMQVNLGEKYVTLKPTIMWKVAHKDNVWQGPFHKTERLPRKWYSKSVRVATKRNYWYNWKNTVNGYHTWTTEGAARWYKNTRVWDPKKSYVIPVVVKGRAICFHSNGYVGYAVEQWRPATTQDLERLRGKQ